MAEKNTKFTHGIEATDGVSVGGNEVVNSSGQVVKVPCLKSMQFTVALSDMTDGGSTAGTYTHTDSIPLGAIVTQTMLSSVTGFAGNTSAVITIGDGTDVDRYNTGTPSVFATAASVSAGAVSGTAYHSAAKDPVVTITSATDFTSVSAGSVTVTIFYYQAV